MDWVTDRIAIGNIEDAMDAEGLRAAGVSAVLCLNGFPLSLREDGFAWVNVTLIDGPGNSIASVRAAISSLERLAREHLVLVHCAEGVSRSAFVVACYLAEARSIAIEEAVEEVRGRRRKAQIDAGLLAMVEDGWLEPEDIDDALVDLRDGLTEQDPA